MEDSKFLDTIMKMYSEVRSYDLHYSTIRTTVATFFISVSFSLGAFLIQQESNSLALLFPTGLLVMATFMSVYFQRLVDYCAKIEKEMEKLLISVLQGSTGQQNLECLKYRTRWAPEGIRWTEAGNVILALVTILYVVAWFIIR